MKLRCGLTFASNGVKAKFHTAKAAKLVIDKQTRNDLVLCCHDLFLERDRLPVVKPLDGELSL
jgi:hypothetical protein